MGGGGSGWDAPDKHDGEESADDFSALEAKCEFFGGSPLGRDHSEEGQSERADVGQHVRGVCHDGQRVRDDTSDELYDHENTAEGDGDDERRLGADVFFHFFFR